ncbi:DUF934 domain-containing protein [Reinekea sp.]|jgi:uncharacterized protein (DUF934 family)|uniref:DUF934 domain-containing protein n=1 Tax=Reinekea sp. TaxID=1970455 RepID=UPI003988B953
MQHLIKLEQAININPDNLIPLAQWLSNNADTKVHSDPVGILIKENESVLEANLNLDQLDIIAFNFSKFTDGRAFSEARNLRDTLGYKGDIRAMGDFIPDQVAFLTRCGFSSFACRSEEDKDIAMNISEAMTNKYQSDSIEKRPYFRRR